MDRAKLASIEMLGINLSSKFMVIHLENSPPWRSSAFSRPCSTTHLFARAIQDLLLLLPHDTLPDGLWEIHHLRGAALKPYFARITARGILSYSSHMDKIWYATFKGLSGALHGPLMLYVIIRPQYSWSFFNVVD